MQIRSSLQGQRPVPLNAKKARFFQSEIIKWHKTHARNFPWRNDCRRFSLLIAEVLLQQTDAEKVSAVYRKFKRAFPTISSLADSNEHSVLDITACLGLRYRAQRLIRIASEIRRRYGSRVPKDLKKLLSLPGVGPYVANAVLASAFGKQVVAVDTNVVRILARFFNCKSEKRRAHTDSQIWRAAYQLLPRRGVTARHWHYAIFDFAALICRHHQPLCPGCPCRGQCSNPHPEAALITISARSGG